MADRFLFYVRHSVRSLRRERRRSLFAAFAIAVGVAAVVGLQTLSLSIDDSVTGNIQATHQADVVVSFSDEPFPSNVKSAMESVLAASEATDWTWFFLANPERPSFVAREGTTKSGSLQWFQPYLVEPDKYPLYGEIAAVDPDGASLGDLLRTPGNAVLSRGIATRMGVGVGDRILVENTSSFTVAGLVANEDSGGVFAPYFVPPIPWFGYFSIDDPSANEVFATDADQASVLFIKTEDDEDTDAIAREIEAATWLAVRDALDDPVGGNVFVHLAADAVDRRDAVAAEISAIPGASNVVELHTLLAQPEPDPDAPFAPGRAIPLVAADPAAFSVELHEGRGLTRGDATSLVAVANGFQNIRGEVDDDRLGTSPSFTIGEHPITLEIVGITAGSPPVPHTLANSAFLVPLGSLDAAIPRSAVSFLLTVPVSDAPAVAARIAKTAPGVSATAVESPTDVLLARTTDVLGAPVSAETAAERLPEVEDATDIMGRVIMVAGLVSLAIGGIGILNTMLVVVGRRTQEIGVLKALGLKGRQVTTLFMIEGVVLGVAGSIVGVLLGIALSVGLARVGQQFLQTAVAWQLQVTPIYTGLIVGIVATTVFGFLPTLAASKVRPNVVLQPQSTALPKTGGSSRSPSSWR